MTPIRAGVIGVGHLGYHHARLYRALEDVELVGVVDADPERAAKVAAEFGGRAFSSQAALLDSGVTAISVAVPTTFHRECTLAALEAGVDVLVEKPIAGTVEDGEAMVATARAKGRILQVGHIERFNGAVTALRSSLVRPRFIECHRLSTYPNRGHDVSVVHDLMIHDLDILLSIEHSGVDSVDAVGVSVFSETEDIANARIRFASGCVANVTASRISVERLRKIRVFSEDAYVSTDYSEQQVLVYRKNGPIPPGGSYLEALSIDALEVNKDEPLKREIESFLDCVRRRGEPEVSGEDGLAALRLADRITSFIRGGA